MHRVELKGFSILFSCLTTSLFLMHRVELKGFSILFSCLTTSLFLMHRVELKALLFVVLWCWLSQQGS